MGKISIIPDRQNMDCSIALAKEYNAAFEYNDFWKPDVLENRKKQEEIIEYYAGYRTDFSQDTMHGAFLDVCVHSEDPQIREISIRRIRQSMDIAQRMGLRGVVFHTGILAGCRMSGYLENWKRVNTEFFTELAAEYPNQEILIENMFDERPDELAGLGRAMEPVDNFGICMDYAHGSLSQVPMEEWVRQLAPYIRHMHINDHDLYIDWHHPVGTGKIDWKKFNRLMQQYQIDATVLIEVNGYKAQEKSWRYLREHHIFPLNR